MNELLAVLSSEGGEDAALRASFEAAARGFGAQKALLLVIEQPEPLRSRAVHILGPLTREQIAACERGDSVRGVSPSLIQRVVASGRPELIEDPRLQADASLGKQNGLSHRDPPAVKPPQAEAREELVACEGELLQDADRHFLAEL